MPGRSKTAEQSSRRTPRRTLTSHGVRPAPSSSAIAVGVLWLAAVNAGLLAMMLDRTSSEWYVWATPTVLVGCLVTARLAARPARPVRVAPPSLVPAGV